MCTYKYGVTSSALVTTKKHGGVPKRVAMQLRKLEHRGMKPALKAVEEFKNRRKAINNEALKINAAKSRGERLPGNKRIPRIR